MIRFATTASRLLTGLPGADLPVSARQAVAVLQLQPDVLERAYATGGWRYEAGHGEWTWHSLRHVFCTTALLTWGLDAADVSRMAGHANVRTTLDIYVGAVADVIDRARQATA